jgi:hypothetical protein
MYHNQIYLNHCLQVFVSHYIVGQSGLQLRCKAKHKLTGDSKLLYISFLKLPLWPFHFRWHVHKGINPFYTKHKRLERKWSYSLTRKSEEGL